jgi:proline-specific peptidase
VPQVNINGVKLNYEVKGQGKDIVLLHGYVGDLEDWSNQIAILSTDYRVSALDQRGRGKSEASKDENAYSTDNLVEDVYQWLKTLGIDKCCLIGHSMGGQVAMTLTLTHPEMVGALVLADTSSGTSASNEEDPQHKEELINIALTKGMTSAFDYEVANNPVSKKRYQKHPETMDRMRAEYGKTSPYAYVNIRNLRGKQQPITERLHEIKAPTLIIYADDDLPTVIKGTPLMHENIADSELVLIENSSHGSMYEKPEKFNRILLSFLNRISW